MEPPVLRDLALALTLTLSAACGDGVSRPSGRPANVVLVTIDALRADHVGWADPHSSLTPALDGLAADSAVFMQAISSFQWTPPSMASLMTGRFPSFEGVDRWQDGSRYGFSDLASPEESGARGLTRNVDTLAELLSARGYVTVGFHSNPWLSRANAFDQGFDRYEQFHRHLQHARRNSSHDLESRYAPADVVGDAVTAWIAFRPNRPFLLWVHLMDPHSPYLPDAACGAGIADSGVGDLAVNEALYHRLYSIRGASAAAARYRSADAVGLTLDRLFRRSRELYRAEVRCADRGLARIVDALAATGELDRSVVVVTADHGEDLGDHGRVFHERSQPAPEELIRVPLLVRPPGGLEGGRRFARLVRLVDLAPTVLDLAGVGGPPPDFDGRSLVPLLTGDPDPPRTAFFSLIDAGVARDGTWKYRLDRRTGREYLFRIADDPLETADVAFDNPEIVTRMRTEWSAFADRMRRRSRP